VAAIRAASVGGCSPGDRHQIAQAAGQRRQRRGHQPGVFAAFPGRDQHAVVAEAVGRQRHLLQIRQIDRASALGGAQIAAIAVGGQNQNTLILSSLSASLSISYITISDIYRRDVLIWLYEC
jgi:hypothetical protein